MVAGRRAAFMCGNGLSSAVFCGARFIHLYVVVCGPFPIANQAFHNVTKPNVYTWNAMISAHVKRGEADTAFALYQKMQEEGPKPDRVTFLCILKACDSRSSSMKAIEKGNLIHDKIIRNGLETDTSVGNSLVSMYAKCGILEAAYRVFDKLPNCDIVSWGAIIAAHEQCGFSQFAILLFERMEKEGIHANKVIFLCTLKACSSIRDIKHGRIMHSRTVATGLESDLAMGNSLIDMYCKCGSLEEAHKVFHLLQSRDMVSYGAMVAGFVEQKQAFLALELVGKMLEEGLKPNKFLSICALKACSQAGDIHMGRRIHVEICGSGLEVDLFVGSCLVGMYGRCSSLEEARRVFDVLPAHDVVLWGAMIEEYVKHEHSLSALKLYEKMQEVGMDTNKVVFLSLLKACGIIHAVCEGHHIHEQIIRSGLDLDVVIGSTIVDMYAKCGSLAEAHKVFDRLPSRNVVSWAALIMGYVQHGFVFHALELFNKMQEKSVKPDLIIFLSILKVCSSLQDVILGRLIHEHILKAAFEEDEIVGNALVDVYAKCGSLEEASTLFFRMQNRDLVTWGAIIAGYVEHGHALHALELFEEMQHECVQPNDVIYSCILKACSSTGAIVQGRFIHGQIIRNVLESDVIIGSALIDMYAKYGSIQEALRVFDRMTDRNVVSWGALIAGYAQHGCSTQAFDSLQKMQQEGIKPNKAIFLCVLKACKGVFVDRQGKFIHDLIRKSGLESDVQVGSTLVDMYAKCGMLEEAHGVFDEIVHKNSVSYGTLISGYALHGHGFSAIKLFEKMKEEGIQPDRVTFLSILKACSSIRAIRQGQQTHEGIIKSRLELDVIVGNALLDMYANCGSVEEARNVFDKLQTRDIVTWGTMIALYARYGNSKLVEQCLTDMQRENLALDAVIFTNVLTACTQAGLFDEGCRYFDLMRCDYGLIPSLDHYNCLVDLFSRVGRLNEARELLQTMPMPPDMIAWRCLLTACRMCGNIELGRQCFDQMAGLDGSDAAGYMLMTYLYGDACV